MITPETKSLSSSKGSAERRITINAILYPLVEQLAERDGVSPSEVANSIILQTLCPYGPINQGQKASPIN